MTNTDKLPLFATRMNLKLVTHKLDTANKGHRLLKSKADALNLHFRKIEEKFNNLNQNTAVLFKEAHLALSKAQFLGANIELFMKESEKYPINLTKTERTISGVQLRDFEAETSFEFEMVHGHGASHFVDARILFKKLVLLLIETASVRNAYMALKQALDQTNRRVNSLEHLLIPKLENTKRFIEAELDEQEREEFYRLKRI